MKPSAVPTFSRVEIETRGKDDLLLAAIRLKLLADDLEFIAGQKNDEETAIILAHHKIKAVSQELRGTNK